MMERATHSYFFNREIGDNGGDDQAQNDSGYQRTESGRDFQIFHVKHDFSSSPGYLNLLQTLRKNCSSLEGDCASKPHACAACWSLATSIATAVAILSSRSN